MGSWPKASALMVTRLPSAMPWSSWKVSSVWGAGWAAAAWKWMDQAGFRALIEGEEAGE